MSLPAFVESTLWRACNCRAAFVCPSSWASKSWGLPDRNPLLLYKVLGESFAVFCHATMHEVLCMLADSENLILCMSKIILTRFWHSPSFSRFRLISQALKCSAQRPAGGARPLPRQSFVHAVTCYFLQICRGPASSNDKGEPILRSQSFTGLMASCGPRVA